MKRRTSCILHPASCILHPASCILLAILLLASFLRFYRLDAQSFWNDEGNSARIAERTLDLIVEGAAGDIHPPGYYLLLHYWRALFGQSEFALRSLSAFCGVLMVAFTYVLGRRLLGTATGLGGAFLAALSPLAVYYSQEARMYALLGLLSAASTYLLSRILARNSHPPSPILPPASCFFPLAFYVLTSAAGIYTHYAFPFVLLVHNGIFGLWWLAVSRRSAHRWRWLVLWAGAQAVVVALYLPWLPIALGSITGWSPAGRAYELGPALLDVLRVLSVGITLPVGEATAALVGAGLLLLAGLWPAVSRSSDLAGINPRAKRAKPLRGWILARRALLPQPGGSPPGDVGYYATWFGVPSVALYLLLPITLIFAFDLYKPAWLKFLVVVLPPFHLLVAHGVENLTQYAIRITHYASRFTFHVSRIACCVLRGSLLLACVFATFPSLCNLYFNPAYARDDYRQIAADIAAALRPGDGIILNAPNQWEVFTYYYPDRDVYPAPYRPDPAEVEAFLAPLIERYRRLFVLYWGDAESDPRGLIETWLAAHAYKAGDAWYGRVRLATYGVAPLTEEPAVALDACFGADLRLRGYALDDATCGPGDILPVTLFWEAQAPIAERYKVTVQLLDGAGQLVAQVDTEPGDGLMPTTTWQVGQVVTDRYGVPLPADLPPGCYTLIVALYHATSGERLPVVLNGASLGDHLRLSDIIIALPS